MICPTCNLDKDEKDFFKGELEVPKKICYKCEYARKMISLKNEWNLKKCRLCRKPIPTNKWVYCSKECADKGEIQQKKDYWLNLVRKY